jgi:hypothetical protein
MTTVAFRLPQPLATGALRVLPMSLRVLPMSSPRSYFAVDIGRPSPANIKSPWARSTQSPGRMAWKAQVLLPHPLSLSLRDG